MPIWGDEDARYFRKCERQYYAQTNPQITYYSLKRGRNVDPLYNEPDGGDGDGWEFVLSICKTVDAIVKFVETDNQSPIVGDEGYQEESEGQLFIARDEWEDKFGTDVLPKEGDVIIAHGRYWDIVKEGKGGNVNDTEVTVGFAFDIKHRTKFTPRRKIEDEEG